MMLTQKQREVLNAIKHLTELNGLSPTLEEIKKYLGYKNTSSVQRHTIALKEKGAISSKPNVARGLVFDRRLSKTTNIPLVGSVACGSPFLAVEEIEGFVPYATDKLSGDFRDYFFLRAVGDSMNLAGIADGDFVLCKRGTNVDFGDIVVALIGDEATIKILKKDNDGDIFLEPRSSNPVHKRIYLLEETQVQGKVVDVISRKK